jgi:hypothetical protein
LTPSSFKGDLPERRILSINVRALSGDYFNGGKVMVFTERPLAKIDARPSPKASRDWELYLPRATAATFLVWAQ